MGARLTCSCPEAYCFGPQPYRLRIHAELFELSADGLRWQLVEPRLLYVTVGCRDDGAAVVRATSQTGRTVLDAVITQGQRVEKISDCFVFWKDTSTRTLGVNTLSAKDADAFLTAVASPTPPPQMLQHNTMAEVSEYAIWTPNKQLILQEPSFHTTMVSVNPLSLVFHHNHGLVHIDLLESCAVPVDSSSFYVASAARIFHFRVTGDAVAKVRQMMNMSSLLLARTTSTEVATSYLQRQAAKNEEKMALAKSQPSSDAVVDSLSLRRVLIQQRLAALAGNSLELTHDQLPPTPRGCTLNPECPLPSCFVIYNQMNGFRMWRKAEGSGRESDLRALVTNDAVMGCPSSSSQTVVPILLPNGRTVAVSHTSQEPKELLDKVCSKLAVQPDAFELRKLEDGFRLLLREEYEVVKKEGKLGLTIYAHNEKGVVRAEVRGVAAFAPETAAVGDSVVAVDGKQISQVSSAADVERLLREGKVIRLRRRGKGSTASTEASKPSSSTTSVPPPVSSDCKAKLEEKMVRGIEELVLTERKYVEDLTEMLNRFLCNKIISDIMEAAPRLQKVQIAFLDALLEAAGEISTKNRPTRVQIRDAVLRVSALFVNRCGELKVYAEYAAGYLRLQRELQHSKELLSFLESANSTGEQHCNYESRMIRPVQRLVQYPLLLKAIQGGCDPDSMEAKQVDAAQQKMQTLAEYVNEMQRVHEQFAPHLDTVRKAHHQLLHHKGLRLDIRDLLIFAHIQWGSGDRSGGIDYVIFVFQTLVLLLPARIRGDIKPKWTRVLPINEVEVDEAKGGETTIVMTHAAFRAPNGDLSHGNPESIYYLSCCQSLLKHQIVKSIRKARSNFAKEGRRPLSGSSQSDGGYGSDPSKERTF